MIIIKERVGRLNPSKEAGISAVQVEPNDAVVFSDSLVDYSEIDTLITNGKKKIIVTDNDIHVNKIQSNMVLSSSSSEVDATSWTLPSYYDGWFTLYMFYVQGYVDTINASVENGIIVFFTNTNNQELSDFYVYTGNESSFSGPVNSNWRVAVYSDFINFAKKIKERVGTWLGEFGAMQILIMAESEKILSRLVSENDLEKYTSGGCECESPVNNYWRALMRYSAAKTYFCNSEYYKSQLAVQSLDETIKKCG